MSALPVTPVPSGFSTRQVAGVLGVSEDRVRGLARLGLVEPLRDGRNRCLFTFRDLALLRTTRELRNAGIPGRRIRAALASLRSWLPEGAPLSRLTIATVDGRIVVHDGDRTWEASSGQLELDLATAHAPEDEGIVSISRFREAAPPPTDPDADAWFDRGLDLEESDPSGAREAYEHAIALRPDFSEAHTNLGRLLHEDGHLAAAEEAYRRALAADPASADAHYNLGVVLEDLGRFDAAAAAYDRALEVDPGLAAAHFNLAGIHERSGRAEAAFHHLLEYRRLAEG